MSDSSIDLTTTYLSLELKNPLIVSASPLSEQVANVRRMEDAGASAVVMYSLFEEQLRTERAAAEMLVDQGSESFSEALGYFPVREAYHAGPARYLDTLRAAAEATDIPIIASLNCETEEGWSEYPGLMQQAGAAALELNVYFIPADGHLSGEEVEQRYLRILETVKRAVSIPVAIKLNPYFSSFGHMARRLAAAGADGLVLFNRFYQPDFDLDKLEVLPNLDLSTPGEIRLSLLWLAALHQRVPLSLAASTGVHGGAEVVKYLLAGADAVMSASALLKHGIGHLGTLLSELRSWMERREYASVAQMKGAMSLKNAADPSAFGRANYIRILEGFQPSE